jgi:hypothetical protein
MSITISQLAANLPGITLDPTVYPGTQQAIKVLTDAMDAFYKAQSEFNANAPATSEKVLSLTVGLGNEQTIFWPPGEQTTQTVRPKTYTLTSMQRSTITDVYPVTG